MLISKTLRVKPYLVEKIIMHENQRWPPLLRNSERYIYPIPLVSLISHYIQHLSINSRCIFDGDFKSDGDQARSSLKHVLFMKFQDCHQFNLANNVVPLVSLVHHIFDFLI